jgi:hypothetical protein
VPLYSLDPQEQAEYATIDALIEAGLICVFSNREGVEVRGYGRTVSVSGVGYMHMPLDRGVAVRMVARVVRDSLAKIEERERSEKAVESGHD